MPSAAEHRQGHHGDVPEAARGCGGTRRRTGSRARALAEPRGLRSRGEQQDVRGDEQAAERDRQRRSRRAEPRGGRKQRDRPAYAPGAAAKPSGHAAQTPSRRADAHLGWPPCRRAPRSRRAGSTRTGSGRAARARQRGDRQGGEEQRHSAGGRPRSVTPARASLTRRRPGRRSRTPSRSRGRATCGPPPPAIHARRPARATRAVRTIARTAGSPRRRGGDGRPRQGARERQRDRDIVDVAIIIARTRPRPLPPPARGPLSGGRRTAPSPARSGLHTMKIRSASPARTVRRARWEPQTANRSVDRRRSGIRPSRTGSTGGSGRRRRNRRGTTTGGARRSGGRGAGWSVRRRR